MGIHDIVANWCRISQPLVLHQVGFDLHHLSQEGHGGSGYRRTRNGFLTDKARFKVGCISCIPQKVGYLDVQKPEN